MKKIVLVLTLMFTSFTMLACDLFEASTIKEERDITIDVEESYLIDAFDITTITITIDYGDGRMDSEYLAVEMLEASSVDLLETPGTHTIYGRYQGIDFSFEVTLLEAENGADQDEIVHDDFNYLVNEVAMGTAVKVEGLITYSIPAGFFLFDGTQQLFVYHRFGTIPSTGDYVVVEGTLSKYETMIQISNVVAIDIIDNDLPLPTTDPTPISLEDLYNLDPHDQTLIGKSFIVQGMVVLRGTFNNVHMLDGDYNLIIYYLSPENAIDALKQHVGDIIEIEVLFYTSHNVDGIIAVFKQTIDDITVITSSEDIDDEYNPNIYYLPDYEMEYDGPRLDMEFLNVAPAVYDEAIEAYVGTGGAYHVNYDPLNRPSRCIDGDTTVFEYPEDVYDLILNNSKSTRYFNIDTPETWPLGSEEEWGATATVYVCEMLARAESIIIQSDPGDSFLDRYDRLLGWIWIRMPGDDDYMLLNYLIVRQGLATVEYLYGAGETETTMYDGFTYTEWMFVAENAAKTDNLGMWGQLKEYYYDYNYERIDRDKYPH